ncbi:MAG TPA: hypothetical protein VH373_20660 [Jatrophihabitantaceae bacterium]
MTAAVEQTQGVATARRGGYVAAKWAGIAFGPLFVVAAFLVEPGPDSQTASDAKITAWYSDSANRTVALVGGYLLIVAAVAFLTFVAGLQERLRAAQDRFPVGYRVLGWTGPLTAGLFIVGAMEFVGIIGNISFGDTKVPQADLLRQNIGYPFVFVAGALVSAVLIAVAATLARRLGLFRSWHVWVSYTLAIILVFAVIFTPMVALPLWVVATSIVLLRRPAEPAD